VSRVLSRSGTWVVLHGASLVSGESHRVAVIVEPAHPARIAPLLMSVYGLTEREQEVTRLVLQGNSTAEIAERLVVSTHTVQQHLKSVFDKTGVRSRRDLVGKVFFAHYEPRLRDNERRASADNHYGADRCRSTTARPPERGGRGRQGPTSHRYPTMLGHLDPPPPSSNAPPRVRASLDPTPAP
jgi:DNA-binding CsgD family transcriptional regulator